MELVEIRNNQVVVSSRQVAEKFGKEHRHVLENIRHILDAENSAAKFFSEDYVEYRGQKFPVYLMNRDGFTLLAMSFTGKEALQWKMKYIQAFNEMEKRLQSKAPTTLKEALILALEQQERGEQLRARRKYCLKVATTPQSLIVRSRNLCPTCFVQPQITGTAAALSE